MGAGAWGVVNAPGYGVLLSAGACLPAEYEPSVTIPAGMDAGLRKNHSWLLPRVRAGLQITHEAGNYGLLQCV